MSDNKAVFPDAIWDGTSIDRQTILVDRGPSYEDWDQIVAEVIAMQRVIASLGGGAVDFVTSVALDAPNEFSVSGSPVTGDGALVLSKVTQSANTIWAGPTSGSPAAPSFRSLTSADLPAHTHSASDISGGVLGFGVLPVFTGSNPGAVPSATGGDAAKFLRGDGVWSDAPANGTVTSVGLSVPSEFSVSGSPVTTNGTITVSKSNQNANLVYAGPGSGAAAAPTFRTLVANDIPTHSHSGNDITSGTVASARLGLMTGDSGTGGASGAVPAPVSGDAGAGKYLHANGSWQVPQGVATVTSVGLTGSSIFTITGTPVTSNGNLNIDFASQAQSKVLIGPSGGGTPVFRLLVAGDLPSHSHSGSDITSGTVAAARLGVMTGDSGSGGASGAVPAPAAGDAASGRFLKADGTWTAPPAYDGTVRTAHFVLIGPSTGSPDFPTFRALVAADLPTHTHSGSDITSGTVAAARLGTMTGDSGSGGASGAVPAPAAGDAAAGKFLKADGVWTTPPNNGTVTSVSLTVPNILSVSGSPVTTSGTLAVTLANQNANIIFAGPSSGGAAVPTFRSLVSADLPTHSHSGSDITSGTVAAARLGVMTGDAGSGGASGAVPAPSAGDAAAGKFLKADGTWTAPPNSGTVTSVALSVPSEFSVSGSPVTTSGTLAVTKANQNANIVFAGPSSGGAAAPTFRSLVALDLPTHTHSGGDITSGTVAVARLPAFVGDSGSGGTAGLTPAPAAGDAAAGKFLKANGIWTVPAFVTSVGLSLPAIFSVSNSPVTSSGTLTGTLATQSANVIFAGPNTGSAAAPTFRSLVAADLPTHTHSGSDINSGTVAAARLGLMTGDSGSGGASGAVPAPATGDAAAGRFLKADGTWVVPPGTATVTSVGLSLPGIFSVTGSPVTTSGTLSASLGNQNANIVFAGPGSGGAATPTFRSLVAADIPTHSHSGSDITSGTVAAARLGTMTGDAGSGGASGAVPAPAAGDAAANKFLKADGVWTAPVTSVAMSVPSILSISGSPVTTTGTLAVTLANQTQNTVFAGSNGGGSVAPTFRALVAADIPSLTKSKISDLETITATPTASAVPKADGSNKIANGWLNTGTGNGLDADTVDGVHLSGLVQTSRTITAGTGLSGGGTLAADRTLSVDINSLSAVTSYADSDTIPIYSASAVKKIAASDLFLTKPESFNYITNGDFRIFQRQGSSFADDTYCLDRWYALNQTAASTISQGGTAFSAFPGMLYCRVLQPQASSQACGIAQIIASEQAKSLSGKDMSLQFTARGSSSFVLKSALLGWTGTADSVTSDVVNNWATATYTAGNFFIGSGVDVLAHGLHSITTTITDFQLNYTWSGTTEYKNLIVMFWSQSTMAQNAYFDLGGVGLYKQFYKREYVAKDFSEELLSCKRFYEKSYELPTAPVTATNASSVAFTTPNTYSSAAGGFITNIRMVDKIAIPTVTIYNVDASGATNSMRDMTGTPKNVAASATNVSRNGFDVTMDASNYNGITAGDLLRFHWIANAEL